MAHRESPSPIADTAKPQIGLTLLVTLALVVISIVVGREVMARQILPAPPLNFDEAAHSLPSYYILRDVLRLDARAFWGDTHIQTLWPPGFSYLQAPVLFLLGLSELTDRKKEVRESQEWAKPEADK